jgi:N-acetylmuramoyl-L-alanine amidase
MTSGRSSRANPVGASARQKRAAERMIRRRFQRRRWGRLAVGLTCVIVAGALLTAGSDGSSGAVALDPRAFAAGACEAFGPTKGDRGKTVFLDAGHGGIDPGGVGETQSGRQIVEAKVNLPIELDTMALLRARGFRVVVSRTRDSTVVRLGSGDLSDGELSLQGAHDDVAARDVCANLAKAKVLVGIYMDAGSADNAGSVTAYDPDRPFAAANQKFAAILQKDVLASMNREGWQIPDGGVDADTSLGSYVGSSSSGGVASAAASYNHLLLLGPAERGFFSTPSAMPGAVIEPLYLTDPFEGSIAASPRDQRVIARGIADAVTSFLTPSARR